MAEQDEAIKVVVEVVDKFSKPLNDLKKELDRISDRGGDGASKVKKHFDSLREAATNVGNALNATVVPALRAVGIGFGGLAATITAAVVALKGFAGTTETLSRLSRETGVSIDRMRELEAVGRRLGISAGEMRSGFRDFAAEMHKTRLGIGESSKDLRLRGLGEFAEQLRNTKTNAEALELILNKLDQIHDPQHRRDFLKARGLPPGLADANRKEREKLIKEWRDSVGATTKEDEAAADRFEHSLWRMGNAFEALTQKMTTEGSLDTLTKSLTGIADLVPRLIKAITEFNDLYGKFQKFITPPQLPTASWEEWWKNFKERFGGGGNNAAPAAPADPKKMSYGAGTIGGAQVIRASLIGGGDEKAKETIAEGVVEGLKKWALDEGTEGPGAHGGVGGDGGNVGGARVIRASLGASSRDQQGATTPGDGGKAVPSHILAEAQKVAASGGPGAVAAYMRQQGYPKSGAWCGEFAAAVVRGAGGTPPAHPEIASNWRNFGERVYGAPQPGDVAVRRGTPTGRTGGHVTIVEGYDPETGRFTGIGGNQGRMRSEYGRRRYDFYRSKPDDNTATSPPVPARPQSDRPAIPAPAVPRARMMDAAARRSQVARIEGAASVRIDLAGYGRAPSGTTGPSSGIFSEVQLHRGSTIPYASESA